MEDSAAVSAGVAVAVAAAVVQGGAVLGVHAMAINFRRIKAT
jgi:hypothetical protein